MCKEVTRTPRHIKNSLAANPILLYGTVDWDSQSDKVLLSLHDLLGLYVFNRANNCKMVSRTVLEQTKTLELGPIIDPPK